jgi:hypothetical protein
MRFTAFPKIYSSTSPNQILRPSVSHTSVRRCVIQLLHNPIVVQLSPPAHRRILQLNSAVRHRSASSIVSLMRRVDWWIRSKLPPHDRQQNHRDRAEPRYGEPWLYLPANPIVHPAISVHQPHPTWLYWSSSWIWAALALASLLYQ